VDAEVVDLRSLRPLDRATIGESVRRTGRPVFVGAAYQALLAAAEEAFLRLESPPGRAAANAASVADEVRKAARY
jgi:pyruvate/2-oxoglutarate/acetoin dehydrogenase E1 component